MAFCYEEPSRTFSEYLLIPNETTRECVPNNVDLRTPVVRYNQGEKPALRLNIPITSSIMQAVSNARLAIALARSGGMSFIYSSQSIEAQADMVRAVKKFKAGFVVSDANLSPKQTLRDVVDTTARTGHSTIPIAEDGSPRGRLLGILTSRDFRPHRADLHTPVEKVMTPVSRMVFAHECISLTEANDQIWE